MFPLISDDDLCAQRNFFRATLEMKKQFVVIKLRYRFRIEEIVENVI